MTILGVIGDVHATYRKLNQVLKRLDEVGVDGILLVGDLGSGDLSFSRLRTPERDAKYLESVRNVLQQAQSLAVPVRWVPGNHDLPDLDFPGNIDHGADTVAGLRIAGIGGAGPTRFGFCYEWSEEEIRSREIPKCDVLLCHCPPARTSLDKIRRADLHVGSEAIRERAAEVDGFLVCGHIHEAPGAAVINRCLCLNAGGLGRPYGRTQVGYIVRTEAGDAVCHEYLGGDRERRWWTRGDDNTVVALSEPPVEQLT